MRNLSPTERGYLTDPEGHWAFAFLEVTNFDGTWINVGNVAVGGRTVDFLNTFSVSDNIDANTLSMSATLLREVGAYSLVPFRSDSPLNVDDASAYSPLLDLHRSWRLWGVILPIDTFPSDPSDYREWWTGIVDRIDVQGDPATITVQGRGMEADIIDARIAFVDNTADPPVAISQDTPKTYASGDLPDVLQAILDEELGSGAVPLTVDASAPVEFINGWDQTSDVGAMDLLSQTAGVGAGLVRYKYDSSDVLSFTLFSPNRNPTTPDWSTDGGEYEKLDVGIGLDAVRNYVYVRYFDATFGQPLVVTSPNASPATATSASIARFRLRSMSIDLAASTQVNAQTPAGNLADAARSDLEFPIIEHQLTGRFWFAELGDYVQVLANGVHYDEDQFGGITSIQHTFANGELTSVLGMRAKPAGRYRGWLNFGPGAPRAPFLPEMASLSLAFEDDGAFGLLDVVFVFGPRSKSARLELDDDPTFGSPWYTLDFDPLVSGTETRYGFAFPDDTYRNKRWYARVTPYSGPFVSLTGVTGIPGLPLTANAFAGFQVPSKPQYDSDIAAINSDLTALADEPFTVHTPTLGLPNSRAWVDSATATIDLSTDGAISVDVIGVEEIVGALGDISIPTVFLETGGGDSEQFATIPAASTEIDTGLRRRRNLTGAGSYRINVNVIAAAASATAGVEYSADGFASSAALTTLALTSTGRRTTGWITAPAGLMADLELRPVLAGGGGTDTVKLSLLEIEFLPALVTALRDHADDFSDDFS